MLKFNAKYWKKLSQFAIYERKLFKNQLLLFGDKNVPDQTNAFFSKFCSWLHTISITIW